MFFLFITLIIAPCLNLKAQVGLLDVEGDDSLGVDGLSGAWDLVLSPDEAFLYVAASKGNAISVFKRNNDGTLDFVEVLKDGQGDVSGLLTTYSLVISPDGEHLYALGYGSHSIVLFNRNSENGKLTFQEKYTDGENGLTGLKGVVRAVISKDGLFVYVVAYDDGVISIFSRNTESGKLSFVESITRADLVTGSTLQFSQDERYLYVGVENQPTTNNIGLFSRDEQSGKLTFIASKPDWSSPGNATPWDITIDQTGKYLYAGGYGGSYIGGLHTLEINQDNSKLTLKQEIIDADDVLSSSPKMTGLGRVTSVHLSPDGRFLFTTADDDVFSTNFKISILKIDPNTGTIGLAGDVGIGLIDNEERRLKQPRDIAFTKDGRFFYVSSNGENGVTVIRNYIPDLEDVSPKEAQIGDTISISGLNMGSIQEARELLVGGEKVNTIYSWSDTIIVCKLPEVAAGDQTISLKVGYYTDKMENTISIADAPKPTISSFFPIKGRSEEIVTILGNNFGKSMADVSVSFGTLKVEIIEHSSSELKVLSPIAPDGNYFITVKVFTLEETSIEKFELNNSHPIAQVNLFDGKRNPVSNPFMKADDSVYIQVKFDKPIKSTSKVLLVFGGVSKQGEVEISRISTDTYETIYVGELGDGEIMLSIEGAIGEDGLAAFKNPSSGGSFQLDNTPPEIKFDIKNEFTDFLVDSFIIATFSETIMKEGNLILTSTDYKNQLFFKELKSGNDITFEVEVVDNVLAIRPIDPLKYEYEYQIGIIGDLTDLAGNPLEHEVLNFTTENVPPTIEFGPLFARAGEKIYLKVNNLTLDSITGIQLDDDTIPTQNIQWFSHDSVSITIPDLPNGEKYITVLTTNRERIYTYQKLVIKTRNIQITSISDPEFIFSKRDNKALITVDSIEWVKSCQFIYRGIARQKWETIVLSPSKDGFFAELDTTFDPIGVEYYFKIEILGGEPIITNSVFVNNYHEDGLPIKVLKSGDKFEDYQMVSVPLQLDYPRAESVFSPLGNYNKQNWRLFSTHSDGISFTEYNDGFTNIEFGKGYYLIFKELARFHTGPGKTASVKPNEPYTITLNKGWNLIGNPYPYNVLLDSIKKLNDLKTGNIEFYGFLNGFITNPILLERFGNLLLFVHENAPSSLKIPVFFDPEANSRISKQTQTLEELTWKIDFFDGENLLSSLGMSPVALMGKDSMDRMAFPNGLEDIKLVSTGKPYFYPDFSKDIVNDTTTSEWKLKFTSHGLNEYQLNYEITDLPEGKNLYYYNNSTGITLPLISKRGILSLPLSDGKATFSIFYGELNTLPFSSYSESITDIYPNPTTGLLYFDVFSEKESNISLTVYTQEGKLFRQKENLPIEKGYQRREIIGLELPPGFYYYRMQLKEGNKLIRTGKLLVK